MKLFAKAEWIFADGIDGEIRDRYFCYKSTLTAESGLATLFISAHSNYAVYVNGRFVNYGQYDGYENYQVYDELDLAPYLEKGENELLVCQYVQGEATSRCPSLIPGVIFEAWDGDTLLLASSPAILSGEDCRYAGNGEYLTVQIGFNFCYDATAPSPSFAPSILAGKAKNLYPRPIEKQTIGAPKYGKIVAQGVFLENDSSLPKSKRMQTAYLSACRRNELCKDDAFTFEIPEDRRADGVYAVLDLGGETNGLLTFSVDVPEETEILIGIGEHLDDLRVRSYVGHRNFAFRYQAKAGHNEFFHPFQRYGLRYLQMHIYSKKGTLHSAGVYPTDYPLTYLPNPMTDRFHRRIWEVGCKTLQHCMHEHYEDCPWREQSLYAMDSRVQILCGYYAFGEYRFPRAALALMQGSLREDNLLELCPPGKVPVNIPAFTAVYVREILEYTQFSGDKTLAGEVLETLRTICDGFISRIDESGLLPLYTGNWAWNFYEWQPGLSGTAGNDKHLYESPLCAFVSDALRCYAEILRILGETGAERYDAAAKTLAEATHRAFYDAATGGYLTRLGDEKPRHALTQAMMLFTDAVPAELADGVATLLTDGDLIPCSVSMTIYAYEALLRHSDRYRDFVVEDIDRVWGKMLAAGADTFWETELGADDFEFGGSLCHGWSAVPIYIFSHYHLPDKE